MTQDREIKSAGGVVCHVGQTLRLRVLVLRGTQSQPEYRGFPKGRQQNEESPEETAVREIREETGLMVELLGLVGTTRYSIGSGAQARAKRVMWYLAAPSGGDLSQREGKHVDVLWLSFETAYDRLTYDADREILVKAEWLLGTTPAFRQKMLALAENFPLQENRFK